MIQGDKDFLLKQWGIAQRGGFSGLIARSCVWASEDGEVCCISSELVDQVDKAVLDIGRSHPELFKIVRQYYVFGIFKKEIEKRFNLSRYALDQYFKEAIELVDISINKFSRAA